MESTLNKEQNSPGHAPAPCIFQISSKIRKNEWIVQSNVNNVNNFLFKISSIEKHCCTIQGAMSRAMIGLE